MSINYTELKAAMEAAGYIVSEGDEWTASDSAQYRDYLYFQQNNIPSVKGNYGLAYTGLLPEGFPGAGGDTPTRTLLSVAITGTLSAVVGATSQLTATGTYDIAPLTEDITSTATWVSATPANATVAAGLVTAVAAGTSAITASVGAVSSAPATFTVSAAPVRTLQSIAVTGAAVVGVDATTQMTATGTYNVAPLTEDITSTVTWNSGTPSTATISSTGLVTGVEEGVTSITASLNSVTSPAFNLNVSG